MKYTYKGKHANLPDLGENAIKTELFMTEQHLLHVEQMKELAIKAHQGLLAKMNERIRSLNRRIGQLEDTPMNRSEIVEAMAAASEGGG